MSKTILTVTLSLLYSFGFTQTVNFKWAKRMGNVNNDLGIAVGVDAAGNVYTVGTFNGNVDFDPGTGTFFLNSLGVPNTFISKLNSNGGFVWAKQIRQFSPGLNAGGFVSVDPSGSIYYTSTLVGIVDADPGIGIFPLGTLTSLGESFITKLNAAGNFVWAKRLAGGNNGILNIKTDAAGNIVTTGLFNTTTDFNPGAGTFNMTSNGLPDAFILKLNISGNFVWAKQLSGSQLELGLSIATEATGNIYCTGTFSGTTDFDPGPAVLNITASGLTDAFIIKLDNNGNLLMAKHIGGNASAEASSILIDTSGNLQIAGSFSGTADLDPGPAVFNRTSLGAFDMYLLNLDASGNFIWANQIGGTGTDRVTKSAIDTLGNLYITGTFSSTVDFDPGPNPFNQTSNGGADIFFLKVKPTGEFIWARQVGGISDDAGFDIITDNTGNMYSVGGFQKTADFDPTAAVFNMTAVDSADIYVLKWFNCFTPTYETITDTACGNYVLNGQTYSVSGTYTQVLVNSIGCDSILTLNLTINNRAFTTVNAAICEGQSYYAGGGYQTVSGTYVDTLLTTSGCDSVITTNLLVRPAPKPNLGPDRRLCQGNSYNLSPGIFNSYLWQDNSIQPTYTANNVGQYRVTVTDANNCQASDTMYILAIDTLPANFLPPDQPLCYGKILDITVPGYTSYLWSTGSVSNNISIPVAGNYYLTVTDFNNCTGRDIIRLQRNNCIPIGIPNAFTPNNDGWNDVFKPGFYQTVVQYTCMIFNRYGEKIFETRDYTKGWDGTFKGKNQPVGTYAYRIVFTNIFGYVSENNGTVLLLR